MRSINAAIHDDIERITYCRDSIKEAHKRVINVEYDIGDISPSDLFLLLSKNSKLLNRAILEDMLLVIRRPATDVETREYIEHLKKVEQSAINHIKGYAGRTAKAVDDLIYFLDQANISIRGLSC